MILEIVNVCCIAKLFYTGGLTRYLFLWLLKVIFLDICVPRFVSVSCC